MATATAQKPMVIQNRYALLLRPGALSPVSSEDEEEQQARSKKSQEYAAFLKEKERKVGRDGFLDSRRYRSSYTTKKEKKADEQKEEKPTYTTVVELTAHKDRDKQEYEKRIKVIEDHMWQHKQEERELKRVEGDIIKNQRAVRRTLRDYENAITRKRLAEEKKLNQNLDKYAVLQKQHLHKKEELTKQRLEKEQQQDMAHKDQGRKVMLTTSDIARQYRAKIDEMELKRLEVMRISKDFEDKMKRKEEEQYRLKQELAELAITLNMEAQKGRVQDHDFNREQKKETTQRVYHDRQAEENLDKKLGQSEGDLKASESNKRRLSADLSLTRAHLSLRMREEVRHLKDTRSHLTAIRNEQKQLNEAALHADMDHQSKQIDQKVQAHNARKKQLAHQMATAKKERKDADDTHYTAKFQDRYQEQQRREHEDHLKHFSKSVAKGEEVEHELYNQVKNSEYARQKKAQEVRQLNNKLMEMRRENAVKMKQEMTERQKAEVELEQRLAREKAELAKAHTQREESYLVLQRHREQLRMDKYLLSEHQREHNRLLRVGSRSQSFDLY